MNADRPTRIETECPGVFVDLEAAARDAAIQAIATTDARIATADDLVAAVTGPALKAAVTARVKLFADGHTPDNDDFLPIGWLPMEARQRFEQARDLINDDHRDLALVRAALADGVAFGMAAIDRLDRALQGRAG
jgi:hypothetical protein